MADTTNTRCMIISAYTHLSLSHILLQTNAPKNAHNSDPLNVRGPILSLLHY
jgi:hypothetical protein